MQTSVTFQGRWNPAKAGDWSSAGLTGVVLVGCFPDTSQAADTHFPSWLVALMTLSSSLSPKNFP